MNSWINLHALWKILVLGIAAGAGLPAIFAIGLRALSAGPRTASASTTEEPIYGGNPAGLVFAGLCFALVLAAIGWGINDIVSSS
jgi:hypothetical protein